MGEAKVGEAFIKHEFDEAIAIQQCIVDAESALATAHPVASAKQAIKSALAADEKYLQQLRTLGKAHGATGEVEDVAGGLKELMESTLETATSEGNDSDFYEAHAVLLNLKRKQWDSAGGMLAIARDQKDTKLRDAAKAFQAGQKETIDGADQGARGVRGADRRSGGMNEFQKRDPGTYTGPDPEPEAMEVVEGEVGSAD